MRPYLERIIRKTDSIWINAYDLVYKDTATIETAFKELRNTDEYKQAYTYVNDQMFYWKPGEYRVTLSVISDKPREKFDSTVGFEVSDEDVELLRRNIINMLENRLRQEVGYQPFSYNFAYPR